ncbi:hypothetical protein CW304_19690 [Bacillus sp. UFRGS-B20]|nr:hypothetical protein CW304_19690 [Bacillus sp. UFRGS-B20]
MQVDSVVDLGTRGTLFLMSLELIRAKDLVLLLRCKSLTNHDRGRTTQVDVVDLRIQRGSFIF